MNRARAMRVFVLGAGASKHAGYPLAKTLGNELLKWVRKNPRGDDLEKLLERFPDGIDDFEGVLSGLIECKEIDQLARIRTALCKYFDEIRMGEALLYKRLAEGVVRHRDVIITFNYDVSLERELRRAGKWHVGDGYGFQL